MNTLQLLYKIQQELHKAIVAEKAKESEKVKAKYKGVVSAPISQCGPACSYWDHDTERCSVADTMYEDLPCQRRRRELRNIEENTDAPTTNSNLPYPATWREKSEHAESRQTPVRPDGSVSSVGPGREDFNIWWS